MLLLAVVASPCLALDSEKAITQYVQSVWTTESGLPQTSVYSVAQTSDGYLWVGTELGLARFDGVRFVVYDKRHNPGLASNYIPRLLADRDGSLWIGTDSGLTHFGNGVFRTFTTRDGLGDDNINALQETRDGCVWVGTDKGLSRIQAGRIRSWTKRDGLPDNLIRSLAEDRVGTLWVGTGGGLARLDGDRFTAYEGSGGHADVITALAPAPDGSLWVGTYQQGLARFENGKLTRLPLPLPTQNIASLLRDRDGNLWIGFDRHGIGRLRDGKLSLNSMPQGLPGYNCTNALYEDREGDLWVGLFDAGLVQLRDGKFTSFGKPEGLSSDLLWGALLTRDGGMWLAHDNGALDYVHEGRVRTWTTRNDLPETAIQSMYEARDGSVWIGLRHGWLTRIHNGALRSWQDPASLHANISAIFEDREGSLWIGSLGTGIARFVNGRFDHNGTSGQIRAIAQDAEGALWLAGDGQGVTRLRNGTVTTWTTKNGLVNDHVVCLYVDRAGAVWAGSQSGGLNRIANGRVDAWSVDQGLFDETVGSLVDDGAGNFWISSDNGVYRVSIQDLKDQAAGRIKRVRSTGYGTADGLRSRECTYGTAASAFRSADGRLWFTTMKGLSAIDPTRIAEDRQRPPVWIEQVLFDRSPVSAGNGTQVGPGHGELEVQFTAPVFVAPARTRFQYRLEGFDDEWIDAGSRRSAHYTNLPPGSYTFQVRAANSDGVWNRAGATVELKLVPHFYQSRWFAAACGLALLVAAFWFYSFRLRYLLRRNQQLENRVRERTAALQTANEDLRQTTAAAEAATRARGEFLANMSHEIRTPMNAVVGMTTLLLDMELPEPALECAEIVQNSGEALLGVIDGILDFSKIESGKLDLEHRVFRLDECLEQALDVVTPRAAAKGLELVCTFSPETPMAVIGDMTRLRQILVNLLGNAVKFTETGEVTVSAGSRSLLPDLLELHFRVRDTGVGIPRERVPLLFRPFQQAETSTARTFGGTGLGLAISRRLCELMGGDIRVESEPGAGSTFEFHIQAGRAPETQSGDVPRIAHKRVLVVDDNDSARWSLARQIAPWGAEVAQAASRAEAAGLQPPQRDVDLALVDLEMADAEALARDLTARGVAIIGMLPAPSSRHAAGPPWRDEVRFTSFLRKPVKRAQLAEAVLGAISAGETRGTVSESRFDGDLARRLPLRILVAEDNSVNQMVAVRLLNKLGYNPDVAASGREALRALDAQTYDVVFMDIQMPEMDGLEATRQIRRRWTPERGPRIVAMTANAFESDRTECLAAGMDDYISKPIRVGELQESLERCQALRE